MAHLPHRRRARRPAAPRSPQGARLARRVTDLHFATAGFGADAVTYVAAWDLQRAVHRGWSPAAPTPSCCSSTRPSSPPASAPSRTSARSTATPVVDVDRGGKITFHGPGQLVGYPIVRLPDHVKVVDYVRRLEEALIRACADFGLSTARVPGRSGVWLQADAPAAAERKIAAIGIRVSRGVTMHGFALNCDVDLAWYDRFVPCGITDAGVTSLSAELGRDVPVAEVVPVVSRHLERAARLGALHPDARLRAAARPGPRPPRAACPGVQSADLSATCGRVGSIRPTPAQRGAMTDLVIETTGLRKEFRRGRGAPLRGGRRPRSRRPPRRGARLPRAPTGPARPRRSGCCWGWSPPTAGSVRLLGEECPGAWPASSTASARSSRSPGSPPVSPAGGTCRSWPAAVGLPASRIDEALDRVGLEDRERDRYKTYSLGHAAAAGDRGDAAEVTRPAHSRRAHQRARPGRHPRHP